VDLDDLTGHVLTTARKVDADSLIDFDLTGVTRHPDHTHEPPPPVRGADTLGLPVLGLSGPLRPPTWGFRPVVAPESTRSIET
jgi:hypothetical protein